jgi:hypothetical protein
MDLNSRLHFLFAECDLYQVCPPHFLLEPRHPTLGWWSALPSQVLFLEYHQCIISSQQNGIIFYLFNWSKTCMSSAFSTTMLVTKISCFKFSRELISVSRWTFFSSDSVMILSKAAYAWVTYVHFFSLFLKTQVSRVKRKKHLTHSTFRFDILYLKYTHMLIKYVPCC